MVEFLFSGKGRVGRRDYALGGLFLIVAPVVFAVLGMVCVHVTLARASVLAPDVQQAVHQLSISTLEWLDISTERAVVTWAEALALFLPLLMVGALAATWSFFALTAKRMHDVGWSGWLAALVLLPGLGAWMIYLFMIFVPGQSAANRYGPARRAARLSG